MTTELAHHPSNSPYTDLQERISALKDLKDTQELYLKRTFNELVTSLNPITLAKASIHNMANDQDVQMNVVKLGLNFGVNLVIDQVLGKQRSTSGRISSTLVEVISSSLINSNASSIISGISRYLVQGGKTYGSK